MYKHPEDKRAQRRAYYQAHREQIKAQAREWHENHKNDVAYKQRKRDYMREWRWRRKRGA